MQDSDQLGANSYVQPTTVENLFLLSSGPLPPNPTELLSSERMARLLDALKEHYSVILIDSPPLLGMADAVVLSTLADAVLLVVDVNGATLQSMVRVRQTLNHVGSRLSGVILNKLAKRGSTGYYYEYYDRGHDGSSERSENDRPEGDEPPMHMHGERRRRQAQ